MDITPVKTTTPSDLQKAKIQQVASEFESMFTQMMLKAMRSAVGENPLIPESFGEKIFTEMLDSEYSKSITNTSHLGLADMIVKELEKYEVKDLPVPDNSLNPIQLMDNKFIGNKKAGSSTALTADPAAKVAKWQSLINEASEKYGVDKKLISAVIVQESAGNQFAVSKAGAKGLMQLMDSTALTLGVNNSFNPRLNIMGGTKYLRDMLDKYDGNEELALASYNAGPGAVDKYNGIPPYAETQNYVKSVSRLKSLFTEDQEL
jgi:soluble lytic murein transglycosylase-like protein